MISKPVGEGRVWGGGGGEGRDERVGREEGRGEIGERGERGEGGEGGEGGKKQSPLYHMYSNPNSCTICTHNYACYVNILLTWGNSIDEYDASRCGLMDEVGQLVSLLQ